MIENYKKIKKEMQTAELKLINKDKLEQLTAELERLNEKTKARAESKGFNIQDKEIDGKKYISFSVKEYLERMIPELK